jgi:hypothetical protein
MTLAAAPAQLPFARRPIPAELFSSWLLRVAAANQISIAELLDGFESRYPGLLPAGQSLDLGLPSPFLRAFSLFCRVPFRTLHALDLCQRMPHLQGALLLRFPSISPRCQRRRAQRLAYAFCSHCISAQSVLHVPWDWCFACLIRCTAHHIPLLDSCPACGELDPLSFSAPQLVRGPACWSCGASLANHARAPDVNHNGEEVQVVQDAYRAALLGVAPDPALLGKATGRAFRSFVDDLLTTLLRCFDTRSILTAKKSCPTAPSRQNMIRLIADLVLNAAPSSNPRLSHARYRQSLKSWETLLNTIPRSEGEIIEQASLTWPVALRRRLASALLRQQRKYWPHSPFQGPPVSPGFKRSEVASVWDLRA